MWTWAPEKVVILRKGLRTPARLLLAKNALPFSWSIWSVYASENCKICATRAGDESMAPKDIVPRFGVPGHEAGEGEEEAVLKSGPFSAIAGH